MLLETLFLSTPSARRATVAVTTRIFLSRDFYPRPPRGGRPGDLHPVPHWQDISIHALREEGDAALHVLAVDDGLFLSTPSARRATDVHAAALAGDPNGVAAFCLPFQIGGDLLHVQPGGGAGCSFHIAKTPFRFRSVFRARCAAGVVGRGCFARCSPAKISGFVVVGHASSPAAMLSKSSCFTGASSGAATAAGACFASSTAFRVLRQASSAAA